MRATKVTALDDYRINVVFDDGISGIIDLNELVKKGIFKQLQDKSVFQKAYIDGGAIAWSEELEIDADNIYAELAGTDPSQLLHKPSYHAAD